MKRLVLALLLAQPAYAQSYEPEPIPAQLLGTPQTMTPLNLGDDATRQIDLGFDFTYWGQTFSSVWVSSNGFVSFGNVGHLCCNAYPIEQAPRNTIYGLWNDLISWNGNPYYRRSAGSFLAGWYGTNEYSTGNQETFEIGLFDDGKIQFNFGSLTNLTYHTAMTGMTGPNAGDNILLFYGRDPRPMQNQSGIIRWVEPEPIITVDCNVTPLDPSCPPQMVAPVQVITSPTIATIQDAAAADTIADQTEIAAATISESVQEIAVSTAEQQVESVTQQVTEAIVAEAAATTTVAAEQTKELPAERLSPDQVAALAAQAGPSQDMAQAGPEMAAMGSFLSGQARFDMGGQSAAVVASQSQSASVSAGSTVEIATSSSSPSSVSNTLEVLNMSSGMVATTSAPQVAEQQSNGMDDGQADTMTAIASVPGFIAYSQVALQDRPDFYAVRDIYRNRRIRDANFEMYRMTQTNNSKWLEMVNEQY
jgi:hypothetical protein